MTSTRAILLAAVPVLLAAGCNRAGGAGTGTPIPLTELDQAYRAVICRYFVECAREPYRDLAQCQADVEAGGLEDLLAGVRERRIAYDPVAMGACRARIERHICSLPYLFVPDAPDVVDDCLKGQGRQRDGQPCRSDVECATGLECLQPENGCGGTCRPYRKEGESCANDETCDRGDELVTLPELLELYDRPEALRRALDEENARELHCVKDRCVRAAAIGGSCADNGPCAQGFCDKGVCRAQRADGEPCDDESQCHDESWCDRRFPAPGVCRPPSADGGPCRFGSHCQGGLGCDTSQSKAGEPGTCRPGCRSSRDCPAHQLCGKSGTCVPLPGAGEPCLGDLCAPGLACTDKRCVAPRAAGEPCDRAMPCWGACVNSVCRDRVATGGACKGDDECRSRTCKDQVCVDGELCVHQQ